MKTRADLPQTLPTRSASFCFTCGAETLEKKSVAGQKKFLCSSCGTLNERYLAFDPKMQYSFTAAGEYAHFSAGVFLENSLRQLLLFKRTKFPFLWTIPAGHIETGDTPYHTALRELWEEVGIELKSADLIFEGELRGDACVGGADIHEWHLYRGYVDTAEVHIEKEEGSQWMWADASNTPREVTFPVQTFLADPLIRSRLSTFNKKIKVHTR